MKRRSFYKRGTAAIMSAAVSVVTLLGSVPGINTGMVASAEETVAVDKSIKVSTADISTFNDTDGDGLGEFQGFGTSLCWWANRVGYSDELTNDAAKKFFNLDEGLGLSIGRYNVGGGDNTGEVEKVSQNDKATFFGPNDAKFEGSNMNVSSNSGMKSEKYTQTDADFGFNSGDAVGSFDGIGWINNLDGGVGSGGNLEFTVKAPETGDYTVKMLWTLSGNNSRGVALKVDRPSVEIESNSVTSVINNAEPEEAVTEEVVNSESNQGDAVSDNSEELTPATEEVTNTDADTTQENASEENNENKEVTDQQEAVSSSDKSEVSESVETTETSENQDSSENVEPSSEASENSASDETNVTADSAEDTTNSSTEENSESADVNSSDSVDEAVESTDTDIVSDESSEDAVETEEADEEIEDLLTDESAEEILLEELGEDNNRVVTIYEVDSAAVNSDVVASGNNNKLYRVTIENVTLTEGENIFTIGGSNNDWCLDFVKMAVIKSGDEGVIPSAGSFLHPEHITRSDSVVPGYCVNVTEITEDTNLGDFDAYDTQCGYAWDYDWDADKNQLNVLKAAISNGGSDFIAEAFSNSPPYFMTVSGCSSGSTNASSDNLRADSVNAFATYMADVIAHWYENGIAFQSATPMNEPYTNYWGAFNNKQEGCHFDIGESQSRIIVALNEKLAERGITDIVFSASDETSIDTAIDSYNALSEEAKEVVTRIDTHTYSGSKRDALRRLAENSNENLWMSEVDGTFEEGTNAGEMTAALGFSKRLITDLNGLMPSAWIIWDIIDIHVSDEDTVKENGVPYAEAYNKYDASEKGVQIKTVDELKSLWNIDNTGFWGIAIADHNNQKVELTKKYYAYGQYSRYIRPGYTLLASSNNTVAAYDPDENKVVIVATNTEGSDKTWKFNLADFTQIGENVTAIRTSGTLADGENWADVSASTDVAVNQASKYFTATVKANSITTFIIDGVEYDSSAEVIAKTD